MILVFVGVMGVVLLIMDDDLNIGNNYYLLLDVLNWFILLCRCGVEVKLVFMGVGI